MLRSLAVANDSTRLERRGDRTIMRTFSLWVNRRNTLLTIAAASAIPLLYLCFIDRYAVNSFYADDWSVVPVVHSTLHGHLSLSQLWGQHNESRLVIGTLIEVLFGFANKLDLRSVIFGSAVVFIATYAGLLVLVRRYFGKRLTPLTVLVIGATWFSVADVENSLWAFQLSWYLTVFFTVMMLCALLVPQTHRNLWYLIALVLALAASLSTIQGFICWPLGAVWMVWQPRSRRTHVELAIWVSGAVATIVLYLRGYQSSQGNTCIPAAQCTSSFELHHPLSILGFFFGLIGNVIPVINFGVENASNSRSVPIVLLGIAIFATSVFILFQSWRYRASRERIPLPTLLIIFALLFDITITVGRGGLGPAGALGGNRFVMANLVLITGIFIYGLARAPTLQPSVARSSMSIPGKYIAPLAMAAFLLIQVTVSTGFGLTNGASISATRKDLARYYVNVKESCQGVPVLKIPDAILSHVELDHLGEYGPTTYLLLREQGPTPHMVQAATALHVKHCFRPRLATPSR